MSREFIVLFFVSLFFGFNLLMLTVTMPEYVITHYQSSPGIGGLASGIAVLGMIAGRLYAGRQFERFGAKRIILIGAFGNVLIALCYFIDNNILILLFTRLVNGFFTGIVMNAAITIAAKVISRNRQAEGLGFFSLSVVVSTALGPFVGFFLLLHFPYEVLFLCAFASNLIGLTLLFWPDLRFPPSSMQTSPNLSFSLDQYIERRSLPLSLVGLILSFSYSSVMSFIMLYAKEIAMEWAVSWYFVIYSVTVFLIRPTTGKLIDSYGANIVLYPALLFFAFGMFVLGSASVPWMLIIAGAVMAVGFGTYYSGAPSLCLKITPPEKYGQATSTFFILFDIGGVIGPVMIGMMIPIVGYKGVYYGMAGVGLACVVLYYFVHGRKEKDLLVEHIKQLNQ